MNRAYEFSKLPDAACPGCGEDFDVGEDMFAEVKGYYECPRCQTKSHLVNVALMDDGTFNLMTSTEPNP